MRLLRRSTCLMLALSCLGSGARAQDAAQYPTWSKLESSADVKDYVERLKSGDFNANSRAFLEQAALPQLAAEGNRKTIERTRKRMREVLLNEKTADAAALDQACRAAAEWLAAQARNAQTEPVVRINAMLMVSELRGRDGRPWPGAATILAATAADAKVPAAVRVVAVAGLARHLDAARLAGSADPSLAAAATKSLLAIIAAAPAAADGPAGDWLVSRALDSLPAALPAATPEAAAAVSKILEDPARPIDVRVRAAAALGATATAESNIDAARSVTAIRGVAVAALKGDLLAAAERAMSRRMSGQTAPMMPGGFEGGVAGFPGGVGGFGEGAVAPPVGDPIDGLVIQRDAWRLMTLANALVAGDDRGLAKLASGPAAAAATRLGQALRDAATNLGQAPDTVTLKQAIATIELAPVAGGATPPPARPAAAPAAEPTVPAANDPFGGSGN